MDTPKLAGDTITSGPVIEEVVDAPTTETTDGGGSGMMETKPPQIESDSKAADAKIAKLQWELKKNDIELDGQRYALMCQESLDPGEQRQAAMAYRSRMVRELENDKQTREKDLKAANDAKKAELVKKGDIVTCFRTEKSARTVLIERLRGEYEEIATQLKECNGDPDKTGELEKEMKAKENEIDEARRACMA